MSTPSFQLCSKLVSITPNLGKCGNLSIQEILAVNNMNLLLPISLHHRTTNVKFHTFKLVWEPVPWYCTSMLWQLSKHGIGWPVSHDHIAGSGVNPSRWHFFWSYPLTNNFCQFLTDCWLNSRWNFSVMVTSLLFEVNYKFINKSFAFSLC